jgi:hypothetical protein
MRCPAQWYAALDALHLRVLLAHVKVKSFARELSFRKHSSKRRENLTWTLNFSGHSFSDPPVWDHRATCKIAKGVVERLCPSRDYFGYPRHISETP